MSSYVPIEETHVFQRFVSLSNTVWTLAMSWKPFAQDTVGKQLVKALDSVGANMAEGDGRYGDAEGIRFFVIARGSAREAGFWLSRARDRGLIDPQQAQPLLKELVHGTRELNNLIKYRRSHPLGQVREERAPYGSSISLEEDQPLYPEDLLANAEGRDPAAIASDPS